jgi:hypothetical protein
MIDQDDEKKLDGPDSSEAEDDTRDTSKKKVAPGPRRLPDYDCAPTALFLVLITNYICCTY